VKALVCTPKATQGIGEHIPSNAGTAKATLLVHPPFPILRASQQQPNKMNLFFQLPFLLLFLYAVI